MVAKVSYLSKDLLSAEGTGQDQEGQEEPLESAVGFKHRQDLRRRDSSAMVGIRKKDEGEVRGARQPYLRPAPTFAPQLLFLYGLQGAQVVTGHLTALCRALFTHTQLNHRLYQHVYGQNHLRETHLRSDSSLSLD